MPGVNGICKQKMSLSPMDFELFLRLGCVVRNIRNSGTFAQGMRGAESHCAATLALRPARDAGAKVPANPDQRKDPDR